ncbi:MAG: glycosyltransferase family 2 protein, partial [Burkholderiales bacterium]
MSAWIEAFLWILLATPLAVLSLYDFLICAAGVRRPTGAPPAQRQRNFAVLIPAHDEEAVIARNVESLFAQTYARTHFRVFVVADHCSDRTAAEARRAGAIVHERNGPAMARGKAPALRFLLERVAKRNEHYDAVCVFDADNLASPDFLSMMNRHLESGERCVQAYLDVKNPEDSWVTGSIAIAYWTTNRLWQAARHRLGLCCALGGTGFALDWDLALRLAWRNNCLTDDLELQMLLVLEGVRVSWAHETHTYDEKPLSLRASWRQRLRWMRGHWDVARRLCLPLLALARARGDAIALDAALYLLQPLRIFLSGAALLAICAMMAGGAHAPSYYWFVGALLLPLFAYLAHFCFFGLPGLGLWLEHVP